PARAKLVAALARAWIYGGESPARALPFAAEALQLAERVGDPLLIADALEAGLVTRWGPDDLPERIRLPARLSEAAAHISAPALRLTTHLGRLPPAWECLDIVAVQRQLRALQTLAEECGQNRVRFFATSRRASHALATGDLTTADELIAATTAIDTD